MNCLNNYIWNTTSKYKIDQNSTDWNGLFQLPKRVSLKLPWNMLEHLRLTGWVLDSESMMAFTQLHAPMTPMLCYAVLWCDMMSLNVFPIRRRAKASVYVSDRQNLNWKMRSRVKVIVFGTSLYRFTVYPDCIMRITWQTACGKPFYTSTSVSEASLTALRFLL